MSLTLLYVVCLSAIHSSEATLGIVTANGIHVAETRQGVAELPCETNRLIVTGEIVEWKKDNTSIYASNTGCTNSAKYSVQASAGTTSYNLRIQDLEWQDGTVYSCQAKHGATYTHDSHIADLWVFDTMFIAVPSDMVVNTDYVVGCQLSVGASPNFDKNLVEIKYVQEARHYELLSLHFPQTRTEPNKVTGSTTITAYSMATVGYKAYCTGQATSNSLTLTSEHRWINVEWSPGRVTFYPDWDAYGIGQSVACGANAKPICTYEWESEISPLGSGVKVPGDLLIITSSMLHKGVNKTINKWKCTATNEHGASFKDIQFTAQIEANKEHEEKDLGSKLDIPAPWALLVCYVMSQRLNT